VRGESGFVRARAGRDGWLRSNATGIALGARDGNRLALRLDDARPPIRSCPRSGSLGNQPARAQ
jgi:hypothetical protein